MRGSPFAFSFVDEDPPDLAHADGDAPLSETEFAEAMAALGPFERRPALAVAVSGGADSLALCLLAIQWAQRREGSAIALTVDHRLRAGSTAEAEQVGEWLKARAIRHRILTWRGVKPRAAIQEQARHARYALLTRWCRRVGILHLLLGHHRRDQAETVALRISRGSGEAGLAAMAGAVELPGVRLLRPLLNTSPSRLRKVLVAQGQPWLEDPSNRDGRFSRTLARKILADQPTMEAALLRRASRMAGERVHHDRAVARVVAQCVCLHPAGFATIDASCLVAAPLPIAVTALRHVIAGIGGNAYPPSSEKVARIFDRVVVRREITGGSLGHCRVVWLNDCVLVCREARNLPPPLALRPASVLEWDRRFRICAASSRAGATAPAWIRPLGREGVQQLAKLAPALSHHLVPAPARPALPAVVDTMGLFSVPHLGYRREQVSTMGVDFATVEFRPPNPVAGPGCFLAYSA